VAFVRMTQHDVVRAKIVADIVSAYERADDTNGSRPPSTARAGRARPASRPGHEPHAGRASPGERSDGG
jgi:hypothetical protein